MARGFVSDNFGFDRSQPWALDAFRLLFNVPRAYTPVVVAWDRRYRGVQRALARLVDDGFVAYQPPLILDTRTGRVGDMESRKVPRYRTTPRGQRLVGAVREDPRVLEDEFSHLTGENSLSVARLLTSLDLSESEGRWGRSGSHAAELAGLSERTGRWWIRRLIETGFVRELSGRFSDVREIVPAHWRITRQLSRQLDSVLVSVPNAPTQLVGEFRLRRSRYLDDISIDAIASGVAADFEHDIEAQKILAALLNSPQCATGGVFSVEPRLLLPAEGTLTLRRFQSGGSSTVFYQPDALITERADGTRDDGGVRRGVIEYERSQGRRDAWSHIERFLGYLHTMTYPMESAVLRFVVDSEARERSYVRLIEAFAEYSLDHPERLPANPVLLAVSSVSRVLEADDPLASGAWYRLALEAGEVSVRQPLLHERASSPYKQWISRDH